jgi:peptidoglycan hydrolase-like protein with peptidoglycan-binding domain
MRVFAALLAMILTMGVAAQAAPKAPDKNPRKPDAKSTTARTAAPIPKPKPIAKPIAKPAAGAAKPGAAKPKTADTTPAKPPALREAYAAMSAADRMAIQSGLTWTGDYNGAIDGEFSDRLIDAVRAYQKRRNAAVTGIPSREERDTMAATAAARQNAAGWRTVEDPVTGARVGIPGKYAPKFAPGPIGSRWSSEQGQLQIETFRIDTGATLEAVFAQQKKQPRRRIASSTLRPNSFVIAGTQGLKKLTVLGFAQNGEVRGLTILYDQAMEGTVDPLVAPMAAAFVPFPGYAMAGVATATPRRNVVYGSGIVVSSTGDILTDRGLADRCNVIAVSGHGHAERIADDADHGLALLRATGTRDVTPLNLTGTASGDDVTLLGIADPQIQDGGSAVTAVSARLNIAAGSRALTTVPALGFSGAAAFDAQGRFAGLVASTATPPGTRQAVVVPAETNRRFLQAHSVTQAAGATGLEAAKASVVRVICVRK